MVIGGPDRLPRPRLFFIGGNDFDDVFNDARHMMGALDEYVMIAGQTHGRGLDIGKYGRKLQYLSQLLVGEAAKNSSDDFLREHVEPASVKEERGSQGVRRPYSRRTGSFAYGS